jgi:hypothetical protein
LQRVHDRPSHAHPSATLGIPSLSGRCHCQRGGRPKVGMSQGKKLRVAGYPWRVRCVQLDAISLNRREFRNTTEELADPFQSLTGKPRLAMARGAVPGSFPRIASSAVTQGVIRSPAKKKYLRTVMTRSKCNITVGRVKATSISLRTKKVPAKGQISVLARTQTIPITKCRADLWSGLIVCIGGLFSRLIIPGTIPQSTIATLVCMLYCPQFTSGLV